MNKTAIKNFAVWARENLLEAVKLKAFEYEIKEGEDIVAALDAVGGRPLSAAEKQQRSRLIDQIRSKGYDQTIEEAAYTWFNRFIALRYMEVNGYLPGRVRLFTNEAGEFKPDILSEAMNVEPDGLDRETVFRLLDEQDNEGLYKYLLITQCNALSESLPRMFEKIANWTELLFPGNLLKADSVLGRMVSDIPEEDWTDQVQIIGWLYQYYNTELKDDTFARLKKNIKITKERIPAATQLFTPDWIVRYMVENSLGRIFISGRCSVESGQSEQERIAQEKAIAEKMGWKYYLPEAEQTPEVRAQLNSLTTDHSPLTTLKLIDPCMGSGHILVYAFEVLMQMYEAGGYNRREAAQSILENNLYGLDIDDRAAQLAYFAVMMKARSYDRRIFGRNIQPHVYAIRESNGISQPTVDYFCNGDDGLKANLTKVIEQMRNAKEYGSILNVTGVDFAILNARFDEIREDIHILRQSVLDELLPMVQCAELLARKYHVVVTNPPYMGGSGMGNKLSEFVKKHYPDSKSDLFAVFMERCGQMAAQNGYQAMITQHAWMFIASYEDLRRKVMEQRVENLIHLGIKAFEEIGNDIVQTCAFVFSNLGVDNYQSTFVRLVDCKNYKQKETEFLNGHFRFASSTSRLNKIPGCPIAYWVSDRFIANFENAKGVDKYGQFTGSQNITGDNERFLRYCWEVSAEKVNKRWIFYAKGGDYRQYYGNLNIVVDWGESARTFYQENKTSNLLNAEYWFKEGITYSAITSRGTGFRYLPAGCIFDKGGPSINVTSNLYEILALLNSNVAKYYFWVFNPSINLQVKDIKNFPLLFSKNDSISVLAKENVMLCKDDWNSYETSWDFKRNPLV